MTPVEKRLLWLSISMSLIVLGSIAGTAFGDIIRQACSQ